MSAATTTETTRPSWWLPLVLAFVGLLIVVLIIGPTTVPTTGPPLDPGSSDPEGLLGLVRTLEELDVEVALTTAPPEDTATRAFLPVDLLSRSQREAWETWVESGGTLIVADRWSGLYERAVDQGGFGSGRIREERQAACQDVSREVGTIAHNEWVGIRHEPGDITCYPSDDDHAWLVASSVGQGRLILLGSATPFTNAWLDDADNAVLATALLAPGTADRAIVIPRSADAEVEVGLLDLVPDGVWRLLILLAAAIVIGVVARARRLGRPVTERLPPVLPSAELATSIAGLSRRASDREGAARRLRERARLTVARSLGVAHHAGPEDLLARFAATSSWQPADLAPAFLETPVSTDEELLAVSDAVARVLQELSGAAAYEGPPSTPSNDPTDDLSSTPTNLPPTPGS